MRLPSADQPPRPGCPSCEGARAFGWPPDAGITLICPLCAQRGGLSLATRAIHLPSGENLGATSAAGVAASTATLPVATSTAEMSELVQSFAFDVSVWLKAIHLPSGDQSKSPSTVKFPSVSLRASRLPAASFATGIT